MYGATVPTNEPEPWRLKVSGGLIITPLRDFGRRSGLEAPAQLVTASSNRGSSPSLVNPLVPGCFEEGWGHSVSQRRTQRILDVRPPQVLSYIFPSKGKGLILINRRIRTPSAGV